MVYLASFWKSENCGQAELPDRSKIGGKCQNSKGTFWVIFKQRELVMIIFKSGLEQNVTNQTYHKISCNFKNSKKIINLPFSLLLKVESHGKGNKRFTQGNIFYEG